jgi:hypothetical protein
MEPQRNSIPPFTAREHRTTAEKDLAARQVQIIHLH